MALLIHSAVHCLTQNMPAVYDRGSDRHAARGTWIPCLLCPVSPQVDVTSVS